MSGLAIIIGKLVFRFGKIGKLVFRPLDNCVARLLHDVINYRLAKIISHMDPSIVSSSSSSSCTVLIFGVEGIYLLAKCCHSCGPLLLEVGGQHGNASFSSYSSLLSAVFNSGVEGSYLLSQLWPFVLEGVGSAWEYLLLLSSFSFTSFTTFSFTTSSSSSLGAVFIFDIEGSYLVGEMLAQLWPFVLEGWGQQPGLQAEWLWHQADVQHLHGEGRCQKERSSCSGAARKRPLFS